MNKKDAVRLWEDTVGDSGKAPTDDELWEFARAVEEKTRKPFVKLVGKWRRKAKEYKSYGDNNNNRSRSFTLSGLAYEKSHFYNKFAQKLQNRLDSQ